MFLKTPDLLVSARCTNASALELNGSPWELGFRLILRIVQHQNGEGANHTRKRLPVKLVYFEEYDSIAKAFRHEKQVQRWSRRKKEDLAEGAEAWWLSMSKPNRIPYENTI